MKSKLTLDISIDLLWKVFFGVILTLTLYLIRDWLTIVIMSFLLSSGVVQTGKWLKDTLKLEEIVGIVLVYATGIGLIIGSGAVLLPILWSQVQAAISDIPGLIEQVNSVWEFVPVQDASVQDFLNRYFSGITWIDAFSDRVVGTTRSILEVSLLTVILGILTFYFSLAYKSFDTNIAAYFPKKQRTKVRKIISEARERMGSWITGQIFIAIILGTLAYIIMAMLSVPYALLLGVLSGALNLIPFIGPILAIIPTTLFAATVSWQVGSLIFASQIILQQLEGHFLTPFVMNKVTGLPPIVVILSIIFGSAFLGPLGAIIAVPVMSTILSLRKKV